MALGYALPSYFQLVTSGISLCELLKRKENIDMKQNLDSAMLATVAMDGIKLFKEMGYIKSNDKCQLS